MMSLMPTYRLVYSYVLSVDSVLVGAAWTLTSELARSGWILSEDTPGSGKIGVSDVSLTSVLVRNQTISLFLASVRPVLF